MAESVKSVLYVDYDSIHRSLKASGSLAADRLAQRVAGWVAAIESGRLVVPKGKAPTRRRMQARRCYADPVLLGRGRLALVACGFEIIDCPIAAGHQRNSAGLQIVLDAMDWLARDGPYDEFVLLSADSDLAPALQRLRAQGKATVIYAPTDLGDEYRALSDGQVDEGLLLALLDDEAPVSAGEAEAPPPSQAEAQRARTAAASAAPAGERNEVEALARKVNAATSVPVFAPRTFADLFRFLAQEIAERGYHFQETADNVTARLGEAGRTATRRQVMFVVKGLALKGHVFSTTDTAERLAEVFREQVNYLIDHAGLDLSDRERELLPSWIAGRAGADRTAQPEQRPTRARAESEDAKASRRKPARPTPPAREAPPAREPAAARETPPPRTAAPQPAPTREPAPPREAPEPAGKPAPSAAAAGKPAPVPVKSIDEIRRTAAAGRPSPSPKPAAPPQPKQAAPAAPAKPAAPPASSKPTAPARPPAGTRPGQAKPPPAQPASQGQRPSAAPARAARPAETDKEALESSILAAIAQAVDVLVEDSAGTEPPTGEEAAADLATPEPEPEPNPSEGGESDDIGDEIQRIIASYSKARQQGSG